MQSFLILKQCQLQSKADRCHAINTVELFWSNKYSLRSFIASFDALFEALKMSFCRDKLIHRAQIFHSTSNQYKIFITMRQQQRVSIRK